MASKKKRAADNYLTHDNWDQEEEEQIQEAGEFIQADEETLSNRVFRKAKRRGTQNSSQESEEDEVKKNPFSGFGGFGSAAKTPPSTLTFGSNPLTSAPIVIPHPTHPRFLLDKSNSKSSTNPALISFWKNSGNESNNFFANRGEPKMNSDTSNGFTSNTNNPSVFNVDKLKGDQNNNENNNTPPCKSETENKGDSVENEKYFQQLSALNVSVMNWIKSHVDENPCIDLQPVFRDYEKHMKNIETKYKKTTSTTLATTKANSTMLPVTSTNNKANIFKTPENSLTASPFGTGNNTANTPSIFSNLKSSTPIPAFSNVEDAKKSNNNLFNTQSPYSFKPATSIPETVKEEDPGEPSDDIKEPERKVIEEKDAFHQIRSKLFFKKGSEWKELGIGMLYLKSTDREDKIQLLIRMETATGKVLLNINVTKDTLVTRTGKNNVMVVSIPNPPVYTKESEGDNTLPCTYLVRLKGTTEADELLDKLKK